MKLKQLLEDIDSACVACKECEPCCTWNVLKKCIENKRVIFREDRSREPVFMSLAEV